MDDPVAARLGPAARGSRTGASLAVALLASLAPAQAADDLQARAERALRRAATYMAGIATHGGWAGIYSLDLAQRWGESTRQRAGATRIWVQPPGTPTVGSVLLRAHAVTGDERHLRIARRAGLALAWGQSTHGGWPYLPDLGHVVEPRTEPVRKPSTCTFDDDTTQSALRFLIELDERLDEPWLDEAVRLGLDFVLRAQYENGAWPQRYPPGEGYAAHYTFNDGAINDCLALLEIAHARYGDERYREALLRGGDFVLAAQLDAPQAGWAQQYSHSPSTDLQPAWARKFEPPAVCSAVTARNIRSLVALFRATAERRFLAPIPAAIEWLERARLGDGRWARFYELGTDRPIYGDRDGEVHYSIDEISDERRRGYSWHGTYGIESAIAAYRDAAAGRPPPAPRQRRAARLAPAVEAAIGALDGEGRWVVDGRITTREFVERARLICDYLAASRR